MDFPEEELDWIPAEKLQERITEYELKIKNLLSSSREGIILRNGIRIVIAGKPNTGKSSLMNLLLGCDRAIVTQLPGTTRDTLEEFAHIRNIPLRLIDTAGIREAENIIEGIGIDRSKKTIKQAQLVLWLLDASSANPEAEYNEMLQHIPESQNSIAVWNKTDIASPEKLPGSSIPTSRISVKERNGIEELLDIIEKSVWGHPHTESPEIAVSSRHAELLESTLSVLPDAKETLLSEDWELCSSHLRNAIESIGMITGETASPDVLENIFSRFCIGK
jgi:tRNA modification GTPase